MLQQINGSQIQVGIPTDGNYGKTSSNINVPGVYNNDKLPDALDKIISVIDKLSPNKSPYLNTKSLSLQGISFYSARHTSYNITWSSTSLSTFVNGSTGYAPPGYIYNWIVTSNNPIAAVSDGTYTNGILATFSDGQNGTLASYVDNENIPIAYKILDYGYWTSSPVSSNVGLWDVNGTSSSTASLCISFDQDPYTVSPNVGFWNSLKATMSNYGPFVSNGIEHFYSMKHSVTGTVNDRLRFIYASAGTGNPPSTTSSFIGSSIYVTASVNSAIYKSGVPSMNVGDLIYASYSFVNNGHVINRFYNSNKISSFGVSSVSGTIPIVGDLDINGIPIVGGTSSIPIANQGTWSVFGLTASVGSGIYATNSLFSVGIFSSLTSSATVSFGGISNNGQSGKYFYVDTVGNEINPTASVTRVYSGTYSYPGYTSSVIYTQYYGPTYTTTQQQVNLTTSGNEELQYQNGVYKSPTYSYVNNFPVAGPNYSNISGGSYLNYRWVTFNIGTVSSVTSLNLNINGGSGISTDGTNPISNGILLFVTILGSDIGWLDANSSYLLGNPFSNGDACVDYSNSTLPYIRRITFGSISRSGTVYVRMGLPIGSNKYFTSITKS